MASTSTSTITTSRTPFRLPCWRNSLSPISLAFFQRSRSSRRPTPMKTLICNCNQTMPLDAPALRQALATTPGASPEGLEQVHSLLCRREAGAFQRAAIATGAGDELLVACTQEQSLFLQLTGQTEGA